MKEISNQEIKEIATNIVEKTSNSSNDYDAIEDISLILKDTLTKMNIVVEEIKKPDCKCKNCGCKKE
jgi:hypothetical protein